MFKFLWFVTHEAWVVGKIVLAILAQLRSDPAIKPILDQAAAAIKTLDSKDTQWLASDEDPRSPRAVILTLLQSITWWSITPASSQVPEQPTKSS